jgi:hypothetical protein
LHDARLTPHSAALHAGYDGPLAEFSGVCCANERIRMPEFSDICLKHVRSHKLRPNWRIFMRHDWERFLKPGWEKSMPPGSSVAADMYHQLKAEKGRKWPVRAPAPTREEIAAEKAAYEEYQRKLAELRWMLAELKLDLTLRRLREKANKANFNPAQPRVPAGSHEGGQWTSGGGSSGEVGAGQNDPRVLSDAIPHNEWKPGAQYAQNRVRASVSVRIGGRVVNVEGGQAARLIEAQTRAEGAKARVRELEPNWKPRPSAYESVEGLIRAYEGEAREAQARASELARVGIGPGPFAGESIPARGPERDFTAAERREINRIGFETGCHTCGTFDPGTRTTNFVPDHQPPNALNPLLRSQRLYPQCISCSDSQGGWIRGNKGAR